MLNATPEQREYTKADGTKGTASYYQVELKDCEGNQPDYENYDPEKPCSDCDKGNPVKNPEIQPQTTPCGMQGGMFGENVRGSNGVGVPCSGIDHWGVDIENEEGDPVYAMFNGTASLHEETDGAGYYIKIISQIGGDEIETNYFHLQDGQRVSGIVRAGDIIGYQGTSGNLANGINQGTTESHVHIKMKKNDTLIDPLPYFKTEFNSETGEITNSNCN